MQPAKNSFVLALSAATVLLIMLLTSVFNGGFSPQYFEVIHSSDEYTKQILLHGDALNIILTMDNVFTMLYTGMLFFTIHTFRKNAPDFLSVVAVVLVSLVALLDFLENIHIYSLLQTARGGTQVSAGDIQWQTIESMMKWHIAYLTFFILGFLLPASSWIEKMLKYSLWFLLVPVGVLVYATLNSEYGKPIEWMRYICMLSGFVLLAAIMKKYGWQKKSQKNGL